MESKAKDLTIYSNKDMSSPFPNFDRATFSRLHTEGKAYELCKYMEKVSTTSDDVKEVLKRLLYLPMNDNATNSFILGVAINNCKGGSHEFFLTAIREAVFENALRPY